MDETAEKMTPMMVQWHACKKRAGSALLLFRMGDFYEAFYDDAALLAKELELTLTKRQGIPMSGVPVHTCDSYIDKLVQKGYRVAVAEQTEDPRQAKGIVNREVVRIVSAGSLVTSALLNDRNNNYIAALTQVGAFYGVALLDLTTADFCAFEVESFQDLCNELHRWQPAEVVAAARFAERHRPQLAEWRDLWNTSLVTHDEWHFEHKTACETLLAQFGVGSLDGYGLHGKVAAINAAGGLLSYLVDILNADISHIDGLRCLATDHYMALDRATQRHLELVGRLRDGSRRHTLLDTLDVTVTPMGARLLRNWLLHPLLDAAAIGARQDDVAALQRHTQALLTLRQALDGVRDVERLVMRCVTGSGGPRDLVALRYSLERIDAVEASLAVCALPTQLQRWRDALRNTPPVAPLLAAALNDEAPLRLSDGPCFRSGYNAELDALRTIAHDSKSWLTNYQETLRQQLGIKTLKVGYNRMFGYYIEVSRGQAEKMPPSFMRRQTLVNAERYLSEELKDFEHKVLTAADQSSALEQSLFAELRAAVAQHASALREVAAALAYIDCCAALAHVASQRGYVRPLVDDSKTLTIRDGRHPVIEGSAVGGAFTPNDTTLDDDSCRLMLITGPNMAGKSTYLRQTALIVIMAQMGSCVPARSAHIGIVDKIFSRIGASDDLARGQSTFMVEMTETANILHNASDRSLVLLDEIGRGTSTYDGISIAWAVAEYLLTTPQRCAKTLFATHYWELTQLEGLLHGAVNYNVAVHESQGEIHFLHKIARGSADKSYGIHVARLAGLPHTVIGRAHEILQHLEEGSSKRSFAPPRQRRTPRSAADPALQLTFFG